MTTATPSPKRVLVVGSWAKAESTIAHIQASGDAEVLAFSEIPNPGILDRVDDHRLGDAHDPQPVAEYASESGCDLVVVTTAAPLEHGLGDALLEEEIPAFAPTRAAARLEWDKAFARNLLAEHCPQAVPRFHHGADADSAIAFAEELDWEVAVKPLGLTEGLGVRVFGDQLKSPAQVRARIEEVLGETTNGGGEVLIEERLIGEEFTIQALVDGERLVPTPAVQDFKRLLPGDRGPNTAGMGSYAAASPRLPFLPAELHAESLRIMRSTLEAMQSRGESCRGFLYGQFMITSSGLKLIEYNFRPGDPEWLNTMATLQTPLLDAIASLMAGAEPSLEFSSQASVATYVVPETYPAELEQSLDIDVDRDELSQLGVEHYYSAARDADGNLAVGCERGLALVARAPSVEAAHEKVQQAVDSIEGRFAHRPDIGSPEMLRAKIERVADLTRDEETVRTVGEEEFERVRRFTASCPPLESYAAHEYKILLRYFGDSSFLIERDGEIVAFEMGFPSGRDPETYFLWQIGVSPDARGQGLGRRLLAHIERRVAELGCRRIELTIDPGNTPSRKLFESAGYRNVSQREGAVVEASGHPAVRDYYGEGSHFMLYEKRLAAPARD